MTYFTFQHFLCSLWRGFYYFLAFSFIYCRQTILGWRPLSTWSWWRNLKIL